MGEPLEIILQDRDGIYRVFAATEADRKRFYVNWGRMEGKLDELEKLLRERSHAAPENPNGGG